MAIEIENTRTEAAARGLIGISLPNSIVEIKPISWREERQAHVDWVARFAAFICTNDPPNPTDHRRFLLHGFRVGTKQPTRFLEK